MTVPDSQEIQLVKTPVSMLKEIAPGVYILSFTRFFEFIPGQVVAINNGIEQSPRLYVNNLNKNSCLLLSNDLYTKSSAKYGPFGMLS